MKKPQKFKRPLTIGLVFDDSLDRNDGIQQYIRTLGSELERRGHAVRYIVGESKKAPHLYSLSKNITVSANKNRLSMPLPASKKAIAHMFKNESFDILHVSLIYSPFMAGRVIKQAPASVAIVGSYHIVGHTKWEQYGAKILSTIQRHSLNRFNEIVAVSSAAKAFANKYSGLAIETISPNVVDVSRFEDAKPFERYRDNRKTIVFLGRLVERKGAQHLIGSLDALSTRVNSADWRVIICGDGAMRQELEQQVSDMGFAKNVEFTGFISEEDKPRYLASADIAIFPATGGESFGIVLIEAMAAGTRVVLGGNNEGYATVLQDGPNLLFNPSNSVEIADRLAYFLMNEDACITADSWRKQTITKYDVRFVGDEVEKMYYELIESAK